MNYLVVSFLEWSLCSRHKKALSEFLFEEESDKAFRAVLNGLT